MSDHDQHDQPPTDLMDAIFRLDDIAEWLKAHTSFIWEAEAIERISRDLKENIVIKLGPEATT